MPMSDAMHRRPAIRAGVLALPAPGCGTIFPDARGGAAQRAVPPICCGSLTLCRAAIASETFACNSAAVGAELRAPLHLLHGCVRYSSLVTRTIIQEWSVATVSGVLAASYACALYPPPTKKSSIVYALLVDHALELLGGVAAKLCGISCSMCLSFSVVSFFQLACQRGRRGSCS